MKVRTRALYEQVLTLLCDILLCAIRAAERVRVPGMKGGGL